MRLSRCLPRSLAVLAALTPAGLAGAAPVDHIGTPAPEATIVGGTGVPTGKWPDAVAVMDGNFAFCTGTLIAPDLVVTAGHCTDGITATSVKINATDSGGPGETIAVTQVIPHPSWESSYDVGILKLASASTIAPRPISPACATTQYMVDNARVDLVGFGATDTQAQAQNTRLNEVEVPVTDSDCTSASGCVGAVSPGGEFGAGGGGIDSCNGDSGGPAYLTTPHGTFLIGVVSRAYNDAQTPCGGGGIYIRADAVADWIEQASGTTLPVAACDNDPGGDDPPPPDGDDTGGDGDGDGNGDGDGDGNGDGDGDGNGDGGVTGGCSAGGGASAGGLAALAILLAMVLTPRRQRRH